MWLTTVDGFFSIVNKSPDGDDYLLVRTRDEQSLIDMKERIVDLARTSDESVLVKRGQEEGIMWNGRFWLGDRRSGAGTDYEWRMSIPRELLMGYFNIAVIDLSYRNFKDHAADVWGERFGESSHHRLTALSRVWAAVAEHWPRVVKHVGGASQEESDLDTLVQRAVEHRRASTSDGKWVALLVQGDPVFDREMMVEVWHHGTLMFACRMGSGLPATHGVFPVDPGQVFTSDREDLRRITAGAYEDDGIGYEELFGG